MNRWLNFREIKQTISIGAVLAHYHWKCLRRRGDRVEATLRFAAEQASAEMRPRLSKRLESMLIARICASQTPAKRKLRRRQSPGESAQSGRMKLVLCRRRPGLRQ